MCLYIITDVSRFFSNRKEVVKPASLILFLYDKLSDSLVKFSGIFSQFQYIRKNGNSSAISRIIKQRMKITRNRIRACIVSIINNVNPIYIMHNTTHRNRLVIFQSLNSILYRHAILAANCYRNHGIIYIMGSHHRQQNFFFSLAVMIHKTLSVLICTHFIRKILTARLCSIVRNLIVPFAAGGRNLCLN